MQIEKRPECSMNKQIDTTLERINSKIMGRNERQNDKSLPQKSQYRQKNEKEDRRVLR